MANPITFLIDTHPHIAKEFNQQMNPGIDLDKLSTSSTYKVWWKCDKGHEWQEVVYARTSTTVKDHSCPVCRGRKILAGVNDVFTLHPELKERWDFEKNTLDPTKLSEKSSQNIYWTCKQSHSYRRKLYRHVNNMKCPECSKK